MDYVGHIYRPPSEAESLLLQVTVGCSHNRCTFCAMYQGERFRPKPKEQIWTDLREAAEMGPIFRRVFLCDGDALVLSTRRLLEILSAIREQLPWVERVGVYGDPLSVNRKSVDDLRRLREAGLGIVYHGLESGDDEVLRRIQKGSTAADAIEMATRLRMAGIIHSVIVLLGIGGTALSRAHAENSARVVSAMDPPFLAALTITVVPGTELFLQQERGEFCLPDKFGFLEELRTIVAQAQLTNCRFSSNHASNYLPVRAELPRDRDAVLQQLDRVLAARDEQMLRPEFLRGL